MTAGLVYHMKDTHKSYQQNDSARPLIILANFLVSSKASGFSWLSCIRPFVCPSVPRHSKVKVSD